MSYPDFFADIPSLRLYDPLAELLGAAKGGIIEFRYEDAVKLAGHSCPTVAGAWLMARHALSRLYRESLPRRGGIRVEFRDIQDAGVAGVIGAVVGLLTGAAGEGGFKGVNGAHSRKDLLQFGISMEGDVRFTRLDTGASVVATYNPASVPTDPAMPMLMKRCFAGEADEDERSAFSRLWQERVRRILLEHGDDPAVVGIMDSAGNRN
jgi:hypothetical protein